MNLYLQNRHGYTLPAGMRSGLGNLFESLIEEAVTSKAKAGTREAVHSPKIEVLENEQAYAVEAELPGVAKSDLKVTIERQRVSIEAEVKREASRKEGDTVIHSERVIGKYARSFELKHEIDENSVVAKLENGVLLLTLPKKQAQKSKLVAIQ